MAERRRADRVVERVREELTSALRRDINDPRVARVLLSRVEMPDDLQLATVHFRLEPDPSGLTSEEVAQKSAMAGLRAASGRLRSIVGRNLGLRRAPELRFRPDNGQEAEVRVEQLLYEVSQELKQKPQNPDEAPAPGAKKPGKGLLSPAGGCPEATAAKCPKSPARLVSGLFAFTAPCGPTAGGGSEARPARCTRPPEAPAWGSRGGPGEAVRSGRPGRRATGAGGPPGRRGAG